MIKFMSVAIPCNKILDKHAPLKKKYVRGNHSSFMNKSLSKAITVRTKLSKYFSQEQE